MENKRKFELVKEFLESWLDFAENGVSESTKWVEPQTGLCINLEYWSDENCVDYLWIAPVLRGLLSEDFHADFVYPFGRSRYYQDMLIASHHFNEDRLAWVRKTIKSLEIKIAEVQLREDLEDEE